MEMTICIGPFGILPNGSLATCAASLGSGWCRALADAGDASVAATTKPSAQILPVKIRRRRRKALRVKSVCTISPGRCYPRLELQILLNATARRYHAASGDLEINSLWFIEDTAVTPSSAHDCGTSANALANSS